MRAANLLREEYPLSEQTLTQQDNQTWLLQTEVCSYEGVGRFVLGLYDDIQIIESPQFQTYIDKRIHAFAKKSNEIWFFQQKKVANSSNLFPLFCSITFFEWLNAYLSRLVYK